jgi:Fe-Mn family superoxide dismutase
MYNFIKLIAEGRNPRDLVQIELDYSRSSLDPSLSKEAVDYHYGTLYKAYVDKFNKGEGDHNFNEAGAFLHSIYFAQFQPFKGSNSPTGLILDFINKHFKTWDKFKEEFETVAMKVQGSGWVYLSRDGKIKTIVNHEIKQDILLLIDWWEHAFNIDYRADKAKYLTNQWKIIDWDRINVKMEGV